MKAKDLISDLIELTQKNMDYVRTLKGLPTEQLSLKQNAESWSVLECIEHLNRYGDFYIHEIKNQMEQSKYKKSETFKRGILGNYFAKSMLPKQKLNKMKTFKSMDPISCSLDKSVIDIFISQQQQILALLENSKTSNLTKVKTSVSISKWIRIRLGDTFRVLVFHNLRHIAQAKRVLLS